MPNLPGGREWVVAFVVAAFGVVVVVSVVGLPSNLTANASCPDWFTLGNAVYCGEPVALASPCSTFSCSAIPPAGPGFEFHGFLFQLYMSGGWGAARVSGQVVEPNGTAFRLSLEVENGSATGTASLNWTAPDGSAAIWWPYPFGNLTAPGWVEGTVYVGVTAP